MNCSVARELIDLTVGGTLDPVELDLGPEMLRDLDEHAGRCAACAKLRDETAGAEALLASAFRADRAASQGADLALADRVVARLAGLPQEKARGALRALPVRRMVLRAAVVLAAVGIGWAWQSSRTGGEVPVTAASYRLYPPHADGYSGPRFADVTADAGITNVDHTGLAGRKDWMVETVGHGAAAFDMDGDGDLDLFVPDGNRLDPSERVTGTWRLYRNDGAMRFTDVTEGSGLDVDAWGSGAVAGDVDGDGRTDLYVPCFGRNLLFRNLGGGRFEDVTARAGVSGAESEWSTAAAMGDLDGDGDLDLYVANYADMRRYIVEARGPRDCKWREMPVACGPVPLESQRNRLFLNRGDGTFEDVTESHTPVVRRYSFQPVITDFDRDGDLDVYVACDAQPKLLLRNDGGARFTEVGVIAGAASSASGMDTAGMGCATGDVDDDGRTDVFVTNFSHESNCLFRNVGVPTLLFGDVAASAGLAAPSHLTLGWGAAFADFDMDGDLDLAYANGHLYPNVERNVRETTYAQHVGLFENDGVGRFREVSSDAGEVVRPRVHRGLVAADFDDDGATDLFLTVLNDRAVMLRNDGRGVGRSARFLLRRRGGNVEAAGARLTAEVEGVPGRKQEVRDLLVGSSFGSSEDPRLAVGLGSAGRIAGVRVRWPQGADEAILPPQDAPGFEAGAVYRVVEGAGRAVRVR